MTGAGIDLPAPARPRYGLRWPVVLGVATLLAVVSSALAVSFTRALGRPTTNWIPLVVLNAAYWYVWALFTPSIVWLSQHFRFERQGLVRAILIHVPSVTLFSFAHIAAMAGVGIVTNGRLSSQAETVYAEYTIPLTEFNQLLFNVNRYHESLVDVARTPRASDFEIELKDIGPYRAEIEKLISSYERTTMRTSTSGRTGGARRLSQPDSVAQSITKRYFTSLLSMRS